jgi:hypothetical protein
MSLKNGGLLLACLYFCHHTNKESSSSSKYDVRKEFNLVLQKQKRIMALRGGFDKLQAIYVRLSKSL